MGSIRLCPSLRPPMALARWEEWRQDPNPQVHVTPNGGAQGRRPAPRLTERGRGRETTPGCLSPDQRPVCKMPAVPADLHDVAPGLWLWRLEHPDWSPGLDWGPHVASTCVESGGEVALLDPVAPPDDADAAWERLDSRPPTLVVVLKPDHVRD